MKLNLKYLSIILALSTISPGISQDKMTSPSDCKLGSISFKSLHSAYKNLKRVKGFYEVDIDGFTVQLDNKEYNNMKRLFSYNHPFKDEPFFELSGKIQQGRCVYYPFIESSKITESYVEPTEKFIFDYVGPPQKHINTEEKIVPYDQRFVFGFSFKKPDVTQVNMESIDDCKLKTISVDELEKIFEKGEYIRGVFEFILNGYTVQMSENSVNIVQIMLKYKHIYKTNPIYILENNIQKGRCVYRYEDHFKYGVDPTYEDNFNFGLSFKN